MKPAPFDYVAPETIEEACERLAEAGRASTRTRCPLAVSSGASRRPMYPVPPVMKTLFHFSTFSASKGRLDPWPVC